MKKMKDYEFEKIVMILAVLCFPLVSLHGLQTAGSVATADAAGRPAGEKDDIVHGTINVVLANRNGIVLLTDSMATITDASGHSHQSALPNQKLFVIDDSTVCTIAGFANQEFKPFSDATTDVQSIIYGFARQLQGQPKTSMILKLRGLEALIEIHLAGLAGSSSIALGHGAPPPMAYAFELVMAGYDPNGSAHIGSFTLAAVPKTAFGSAYYEVQVVDSSFETVDSSLKYVIRGQSFVAETILSGMLTARQSRGPVLSRYEEAKAKDEGASLTLDELRQLASFLAARTATMSASVGGEDQVAILRPTAPIELQQRHFPEPTSSAEPVGVFVSSRVENVSSAAVVSSHPMMYIASYFDNSRQDLDRNYFVGNTFVECQLIYGGKLLGLDKTNVLIDSRLFVRRTVERNSKQLQELVRNFPWSSVTYEEDVVGPSLLDSIIRDRGGSPR